MTVPASLPLSGLRVAEFTHMIMGPACGLVLADLGAEVIKVEPPDGDRTRRMTGLGVGFFRSFNRNKKSVSLDLETEQGRQDALALIATCDVLIENFRPGHMDAKGLGAEQLTQQFPRLIYVSHKGFLAGPYEHRVALDEVVQMMGGLAYMTGPPGRPLRAGASVNDIMGGMFGAIGVLAALRERDVTGRGRVIQSALFENCVLLAATHMQQHLMTGQVPSPMPARVSPWTVYDVFEVADGEQLFIGAVSDRQWALLCETIGRQDLLTDPDLATNAQRLERRSWLLEQLGNTLRVMPLAQLVTDLDRVGLPYAPIRRPEQLNDDPHLLASDGLMPMECEDGSLTQVVPLPISIDGQRLPVRMPLARVGQHNDEILGAGSFKKKETTS